MAQSQLSFLKRSGASKKSFSTKIDTDVDERWRELEKRIAVEAPSLSIDRGTIVEEALRDAIDKANKYLDALPRANK